MIIDKCPHCATAHVNTKTETSVSGLWNDQPNWAILRCANPSCSKLILIEILPPESYRLAYPPQNPSQPDREDIPKPIINDYNEAGKCIGAGAYGAALVMSRRVLQRLLKEQGHTEKKLVDAIDSAKSAQTIPTRYHDLADEIREYGNLGAHPDDDQLKNATEPNARQILGFCDLLIDEIYDLPARAARLRQARQNPGD